VLIAVLFCASAPCSTPFARAGETDEDVARAILAASGVRGGLVVDIGCGDGRLTAALRANDGYLVHGLDSDSANVENARGYILSKGLYGKVSIGTFDGKHLPYADNLVSVAVISDQSSVISGEVERVLAPGGVCVSNPKSQIQNPKWIKPVPDEIDDWTHYLFAFREGPTAIPRRLVAVGDRVYATLGIRAPVSVLDAASGNAIHSYEDTTGAEEIIVSEGVLFAAGSPDLVDEEAAYTQSRDSGIQKKLTEQDIALGGGKGAVMWAISAVGKKLAAYELDSPPVFDGMIAAESRLYTCGMDGRIVCMGSPDTKDDDT